MTDSVPESPDFLGRIEQDMALEASSDRAFSAAREIRDLLEDDCLVGDLIRMDFGEAHVLVHDALRQQVGGVPQGCLLLAGRSQGALEDGTEPAQEMPSLLLLRVLGSSALPNDIEMQQARFLAGQRASDSPDNWDENRNTDQFTLNQMRFAGLRCSILGTFRMVKDRESGKWRLAFGSDIDNFYAGQGMKVYKPVGDALKRIVNFSTDEASEFARVRIGEVKYAAALDDGRPESVPVLMSTRDVVAQRTALFGMTRTGKSNTVKTLARAVYALRLAGDGKERVAQLIIDPNGEYANDNPQDDGCLRNVRFLRGAELSDVVTYGLTPHPNDPERRITRMNFFGPELPQQPPSNVRELAQTLRSLEMGKQLIDDRIATETAGYIASFRNTELSAPPGIVDYSEYKRYRRAVFVYQCILADAGFKLPRPNVSTGTASGKLFNAQVIEGAGGLVHESGRVTWDAAIDFCKRLGEWLASGDGKSFNERYRRDHDGRNWSDDRLSGLLGIFENTRGVRAIRECREWHDPQRNADYTDEIVADLGEGKLVILDQALGDPVMNEQSAERIMRAIFTRQQQRFTNPVKGEDGSYLRPDPVIVYVEEAHTVLPRGSEEDTRNIWARTAKEGAKFNIGLVYSTQEPSSVQRNILRNTENWFLSHLNNTGETRELDQYNDFADFTSSVRRVKEVGFLKVRTMSSPYTLPVQIDRFTAPREGSGS